MEINHGDKDRKFSDTLVNVFEKTSILPISSSFCSLSWLFARLGRCVSVCFPLFSTQRLNPICVCGESSVFSEHDLNPDLIARVIFRLLPMKGPFTLAIDRTNWEFGSTDINIFMPTVIHDGVVYPLLFSMLPKMGTSNSQERIRLIKHLKRIENQSRW